MDQPLISSREERETSEVEMLASYAMKSKDSKSKPKDERTIYHHDRDVIQYSENFDRMQGKSQVFPSYIHDHFRTRCTHTIQVASISEGISKLMRLNHELAEAIAYGHDLGHTPFGHKGEDILKARLLKEGLEEGFNHNMQSWRICKKLGISEEVLEGLLKHESPWDEKTNEYKDDSEKPLLEAQVVDLSDEIAYTAHDLKDGLKAGILKLEDVKKLKLWQRAEAKISLTEDEFAYISKCVSAIIKVLIHDVKNASLINIQHEKINTIEDVRNAKAKLITHSREIYEELEEARKYLDTNLYQSDTVKGLLKIADHIIGPLFDFYLENPQNMQPHYAQRFKEDNKLEVVRDYVAGMTDQFAIDEAIEHNIITQQQVHEMSQM